MRDTPQHLSIAGLTTGVVDSRPSAATPQTTFRPKATDRAAAWISDVVVPNSTVLVRACRCSGLPLRYLGSVIRKGAETALRQADRGSAMSSKARPSASTPKRNSITAAANINTAEPQYPKKTFQREPV